jgi:hypothetical protein
MKPIRDRPGLGHPGEKNIDSSVKSNGKEVLLDTLLQRKGEGF